jgi:glycolate oxidase iron-sulfur subunit
LDIRDQTFQEEMSLCLNCRACEAVCPSGVKYGELVETARAQIRELDPPPVKTRALEKAVFKGVFSSPTRFRAASAGLRFYQRSGVQTAVRRSGVLGLLGLEEQEALLPELSERFVVPGAERWPAEGEQRGTVALLAGCVMSTAYADIHRATARVLAINGFTVVLPPAQGCCGALPIHAGDFETGRAMARANIAAFDSPEVDIVLSNAAGCGAAMREYDFLLRDDPAWAERARHFVSRVRDVSEFLADAGLREEPGRLDLTVTYQEPCHLAHAQRVTRQPRTLLNSIPGLKLVEMTESSLCCGSAGIYNLTQPDMASDLLDRKLRHALETDAQAIVTANPGCLLQLQAGLQARGDTTEVGHIMTLLDRAYAARAVESHPEIGERT